MKRFASIKNCSRFSALCNLPQTFFKKIFKKFRNFIHIFLFLFLKCFRLREKSFCCSQLGKNGFRDLCVSLRVFFGAEKLMNFQQGHFTLGSPYDFAHLVFFKVRNLLRKCLRSTASPLCKSCYVFPCKKSNSEA